MVISTSDKDLAQLVTAQVTLVNTMTDTILDRAGVREKFGVDPEQIIDLLALTGIASITSRAFLRWGRKPPPSG